MPKRRGRIRTALGDAGLSVREHLIWRPADAIRAAADAVKSPFESAAFAVRRGAWRLGDRFDSLSPLARGGMLGLAILLVAAAAVSGLLLATPSRDGAEATTVAAAPPVPATPVPAPEPQQPTLKGAAPTFAPEAEGTGEPAKGEGSSPLSSDASATSSAGPSRPLSPFLSSIGPKPGGAVAGTDARKGEEEGDAVAGPKALEVARRFAAAFVLYETGRGDKAELRRAFAQTTDPELRRSLLRRPPRLPANLKVPKAKVLNVVPGPAQGGTCTVSVALLRVGLTSELRLDMEPAKDKRWLVTDILG